MKKKKIVAELGEQYLVMKLVIIVLMDNTNRCKETH